MLNGSVNSEYYYMNANKNYIFTPTVTGTYWLRLDVNKNGGTATFSNINIVGLGKISGKKNGETYGELPTPARTGYTFAGWYTAASGGTKITEETIITTASDHTIYGQWTS